MWYVYLMDTWSNPAYIGPFELGSDAAMTMIALSDNRPDWDVKVVTAADYEANVKEHGPAKLTTLSEVLE